MNKWISRVWEAPQKALAHIVKWIYKAEMIAFPIEKDGTWIYLWDCEGGMSLSNHIFLPRGAFGDELYKIASSKWHRDYIKHETGHTMQSRKLGPLYLLVIGLPSIIWAGCFEGWRRRHNKSYYWFYTEASADKLGGVDREG